MAKRAGTGTAGKTGKLNFAGKIGGLRFLESEPPEIASFPSLCAISGADDFLRRRCDAKLRAAMRTIGGDDAEFSISIFNGLSPQTGFRDIISDLSSKSLFGVGPRRLVIVEQADDFVANWRTQLEDYAAKPNSSSILLLEPTSFPMNTRLAKAFEKNGVIIDCAPPKDAELASWLNRWAEQTYQVRLDPNVAEQLLEMIGPSAGLLDQELAKLSLLAINTANTANGKDSANRTTGSTIENTIDTENTADTTNTKNGVANHTTENTDHTANGENGAKTTATRVTLAMVGQLSGNWRTRDVWNLLDQVLNGNVSGTLAQLDRLLSAGEAPIMILASASLTLRRFAAATRLRYQTMAAGRSMTIRESLEQVGTPPFTLGRAEVQLRRLGAERALRLYPQLVETDLALKGYSRLEPRMVLERFLVMIANIQATNGSGPSPISR